MNISKEEQLKAAYALNLWTVSVSRIIDYNDAVILDQEYDTIMNNLNLENMPKDEALLDIIKQIMDTITSYRIGEGDRKIVDMEYQRRMKDAIWNAVPNVGAIFATGNPIALGLTLATTVGTGYMNYRREKANNSLTYVKAKWEIERNQIAFLNGLLKELFETAWKLSDAYQFPDEYRLTQQLIKEYNKALLEPNNIKRWNSLNYMKDSFSAYPNFWYEIGSAANNVYRSKDVPEDIKLRYRGFAIEAFEKYYELNKFRLLRNDMITSSWALEYLELLDLNSDNQPEKARELIEIAENSCGNTMDVLQLCAFAYLRIKDNAGAIRVLKQLVNNGYNPSINIQLLSGLYIVQMFDSDEATAKEAEIEYRTLELYVPKEYILPLPSDGNWDDIAWNKEPTKEELDEQEKAKIREAEETNKAEAEQQNEAKKRARQFYVKPIRVVYEKGLDDKAQLLIALLNETKQKIDPTLPPPTGCKLSEYKKANNKKANMWEDCRIIYLGSRDEANKIQKVANLGCKWSFDKYGMKYISFGENAALCCSELRNRDISGFLNYVKKLKVINTHKGVSDAATAKNDFMFEVFDPAFDSVVDVGDFVSTLLALVIVSPLMLVGGLLGEVLKLDQVIKNQKAKEALKYLQYMVLFYEYLDSEHALLEPIK